MFSLGVVVWEVMARRVPGGPDGFMLRQARSKFQLDFEALRACLPPAAPASLITLATECCAYEAEYRPTARDAHEWATDLLAELVAAEAPAPAPTEAAAPATALPVAGAPPGTPVPSAICARPLSAAESVVRPPSAFFATAGLDGGGEAVGGGGEAAEKR